jgi:hypothetical protein
MLSNLWYKIVKEWLKPFLKTANMSSILFKNLKVVARFKKG